MRLRARLAGAKRYVEKITKKEKTEKCGKGLDIFSVLGYNRDKEALTNSQRPPTVNNRPLHFGRV